MDSVVILVTGPSYGPTRVNGIGTDHLYQDRYRVLAHFVERGYLIATYGITCAAEEMC